MTLPETIKAMAGELLNQVLEAPDRDTLHYGAGTGNGYALGVATAKAVSADACKQLIDV